METFFSFVPPWWRLAVAGIGSFLLWYGTSQLSVAGLIVMLAGLVGVVWGVIGPPLWFREREPLRFPGRETPRPSLHSDPPEATLPTATA